MNSFELYLTTNECRIFYGHVDNHNIENDIISYDQLRDFQFNLRAHILYQKQRHYHQKNTMI